MDALITNLSATEGVFVPGPNLDLPASGSATWPDIAVADLDDPQLRALVSGAKISISVSAETIDAVQSLTGSMGPHGLPKYTVANLPTGYEGRVAFATNGRRTGQGGGAGLGVPCYFSAAAWRVFYDDTTVAA